MKILFAGSLALVAMIYFLAGIFLPASSQADQSCETSTKTSILPDNVYPLAQSLTKNLNCPRDGKDLLLSKLGMKDVDDPSVPDLIKKAASSVASLGGMGDGHFIMPVKPEFLAKPIVENGEQKTMKDLLLRYGGIMSDGSHPGLNLRIMSGADWVIPYLIKAGANRGPAKWERNDPSDQDLSNVPGTSYCTGFLVAKDLFLTNNHCISTEQKCSATFFRFNEELNLKDKTVKQLEAFQCDQVVLTDKKMDFSLIRVKGNPGDQHVPLKLAATSIANPNWQMGYKWKKEKVFIIGHPGAIDDQAQCPLFQSIKKISGPCDLDSYGEQNVMLDRNEVNGGVSSPVINFDQVLQTSKVEASSYLQYTQFVSCGVIPGNSGSPIISADDSSVAAILDRGGSEYGSSGIPMSQIFKAYGTKMKALGVQFVNEP